MRVILAASLLFLIACNSADKKDAKEAFKAEGAYHMLSQNLKSDKTDTTDNSLQQLKLFTGDYMMYANVNAPDSVSSFGVGSYSIAGDTIITEHVIYSANAGNKDDTARTYTLAVEKTAKGYKQVIADIGGINDTMHSKLTEEYENAGTETKTPLDGVWKLTKAVTIRGKDTTVDKITQYKAYYAGHVIFGHTYTDSLNKIHTGVGFGKFEMNGNNKAKELMKTSTYYQVRGNDFDLDITLNGADEFTQTIKEKDGTTGIETYQRLKK